ncbi:hypothetical protein GTO89_10180 [Heliobacterium gestii]|uniref:Uncharacterized protein n=1 Tax=Heliomicrobium gestii TaxID=2699 RepID=A0A845LB42_HELGE|nr:hypothetical protein [Heliomicrobium gestii]MBM7868210.1 hypothetical protein [Heliomicrobium gestii]MZP43408.1 hypothetical protein [Heliomicrobium gestii]
MPVNKDGQREGEHPSEYLNDMVEWGNQQYNPGRYLGGDLPPHLKYPKPIIRWIAGLSLLFMLGSLIYQLIPFAPPFPSRPLQERAANPTAIHVDILSKQNLDSWDIGVEPRLTDKGFVIDVHREYRGQKPLEDVMIQTESTSVTSSPNQPYYKDATLGIPVQHDGQENKFIIKWTEEGMAREGTFVIKTTFQNETGENS